MVVWLFWTIQYVSKVSSPPPPDDMHVCVLSSILIGSSSGYVACRINFEKQQLQCHGYIYLLCALNYDCLCFLL